MHCEVRRGLEVSSEHGSLDGWQHIAGLKGLPESNCFDVLVISQATIENIILTPPHE